MSEMQKTFLLGVGCQKSGTTWLHRQLETHENTNMGFAKEYHIFDALHVPDCAHFHKRAVLAVAKGREDHNHRHFDVQQQRLGFFEDTDCYYRYFRDLADEANQTLLVGDITPSYCALPVDTYREIRQKLLAHGFKIRVVFFMRDPVERIWSMARMKRNDTERALGLSEVDTILKHYKTTYTKVRSRYERTIVNLEQVFEPGELYYEFYERLFDPQRIARLMDFLALPQKPLDLGKRIHGTDKTESIPDEIKALVAKEYRKTYAFVAQRYGVELIDDLWPSARLL